jgi:hypothetical protein
MVRLIPPITVGIGARTITTGVDSIKGQTSEGFGGAFGRRYRRKKKVPRNVSTKRR